MPLARNGRLRASPPMASRLDRLPWLSAVLSPHGPKTKAERLVAAALFTNMNRLGGNAYPSERTLSANAGVSRSTVQKALKGLLDSGWLIRHECGRGNFGKPRYVYEATVPDPIGHPCANRNGPTGSPTGSPVNGLALSPSAQNINGLNARNQWADSGRSLDRTPAHNQLTYKNLALEKSQSQSSAKKNMSHSEQRLKLEAFAKNALDSGKLPNELDRLTPLDLRYLGYESDLAAFCQKLAVV